MENTPPILAEDRGDEKVKSATPTSAEYQGSVMTNEEEDFNDKREAFILRAMTVRKQMQDYTLKEQEKRAKVRSEINTDLMALWNEGICRFTFFAWFMYFTIFRASPHFPSEPYHG